MRSERRAYNSTHTAPALGRLHRRLDEGDAFHAILDRWKTHRRVKRLAGARGADGARHFACRYWRSPPDSLPDGRTACVTRPAAGPDRRR